MFDFKRHSCIVRASGLVLMGLLVSQSVYAQLNDPTLPPNVSTVVNQTTDSAASWQLSSILVSPQRSVAIINGKSVQPGEILSGAKVLSISETGVKLKHRGEIIQLKLFPANVKILHGKQK